MTTTVSRSGQSALISDDDEFFRSALRAILMKKLGFGEVVETGSFDEAVDFLGDNAAGAQPVSLALFDLSMPGISNPSNLRSVREIMPDLPLVVISASEQRSDILTSLAAGVHGYVPKGVGIRELERALQRILAGDMYAPAMLAEVEPAAKEIGTGGAEMAATQDALPDLTPRQRDVLELVVEGKSNKEIARTLGLGGGTVKVHMAALFRNLGVSNRTAAAAAASPLLRDRH